MEISLKKNSVINDFESTERTEFLDLVITQIENTFENVSENSVDVAALLHKLAGGLSYIFADEVIQFLKNCQVKYKEGTITETQTSELLTLLKNLVFKVKSLY